MQEIMSCHVDMSASTAPFKRQLEAAAFVNTTRCGGAAAPTLRRADAVGELGLLKSLVDQFLTSFEGKHVKKNSWNSYVCWRYIGNFASHPWFCRPKPSLRSPGSPACLGAIHTPCKTHPWTRTSASNSHHFEEQHMTLAFLAIKASAAPRECSQAWMRWASCCWYSVPSNVVNRARYSLIACTSYSMRFLNNFQVSSSRSIIWSVLAPGFTGPLFANQPNNGPKIVKTALKLGTSRFGSEVHLSQFTFWTCASSFTTTQQPRHCSHWSSPLLQSCNPPPYPEQYVMEMFHEQYRWKMNNFIKMCQRFVQKCQFWIIVNTVDDSEVMRAHTNSGQCAGHGPKWSSYGEL